MNRTKQRARGKRKRVNLTSSASASSSSSSPLSSLSKKTAAAAPASVLSAVFDFTDCDMYGDGGEYKGQDSYNVMFKTIEECWHAKIQATAATTSDDDNDDDGEEEKDQQTIKYDAVYEKGANYWGDVECTNNGMLGGFEEVSPVDIRASKEFVRSLPNLQYNAAMDCGAGIGRVVGELLLPSFEHVDMVEQNPAFIATAKQSFKSNPRMRNFYNSSLQSFVPSSDNKYDIIWIQWVIGHLAEPDCAAFLTRCANALTPTGYICLKENTAARGFLFDDDDGAVTRDDWHFKQVFKQAGLHVIHEAYQLGFPDTLYPVKMYALQQPQPPPPAAAATPSL